MLLCTNQVQSKDGVASVLQGSEALFANQPFTQQQLVHLQMQGSLPALGMRSWEDGLQGYNLNASAPPRYNTVPGSPNGYYPHVSSRKAFPDRGMFIQYDRSLTSPSLPLAVA